MNIGFLGLGSLGTLLAYHCRDQMLFALPKTPLASVKLTLKNHTELWQAHLACWQGEPLDWLVVSTKAAQTLPALSAWATHLPKVKNILLLQNGMGQQEQAARWLSHASLSCKLWAAMSTEGAYKEGNTVVYAGVGHTLIGLWPDGTATAPLLPSCQFTPSIKQAILGKLAVNAVINPLTGFYRCKNGELVTNPPYRQKLVALSQEVAELYRKLGWHLPQDLAQLVEDVATKTAANTSSTLQDILANRPTELAYISGFLLEQAKAISHPLPITQQLYATFSA
ncbi:MAG: 2-dehydropantoate 2-reductase [Venatoribacter sp.]